MSAFIEGAVEETGSPEKPQAARKASIATQRRQEAAPESVDLSGPRTQLNFRAPIALVERAKDLAAVTNLTVTDLITEGLRRTLEERLAEYRQETGRSVPKRQQIRLMR
ncbi:MAG: hypothetical protein KDD47_06335 [Acidobacteria bacterium]|nr:hypothetical protein [Acidobacteriota bacterium]